MKHLSRSGHIEYTEDNFETSMEKATGKAILVRIAVCMVLGFFASAGLYIGVVKVLNWVWR
jgi:hypothetical protein